MKVLVIGGTRFLGYHLVHRLLDEDIEVVLFNRGISGDDFGDRVKRIRGNRKDYKGFYDTFRRQRFDAVIDLIGYEAEEIEVTIKTFRDHIGQYIFISTGQVYLVTENRHQPAHEEDYYQPLIDCPPGEEEAYAYGIKKRQCEDLLEEAFAFHQFPVVRFRCPIIHGPRDYTLRLYSYLIRIQDGYPLIIPEGGNSIIRHVYVQDVVQAIMSVMQVYHTRGKVYNLASSEVMYLSEFLEVCTRHLEKSLTLYEIPKKLMREYGVSADVSPFSSSWVSYLDPALAEEEIHFCSTPITQWLGEVIHWFISHYQGQEPANYRQRPAEMQLAQFWQSYKALD